MEAQTQEISQTRQSNKRKRDSPGLNGRTRRQTSAAGVMQPNDHIPSELERHYYTQQNGNVLSTVRDEVARHVAEVDPSSSTAAAALAASMPQLTVPQPTELSFPSTNSGNEDERQIDSSFDIGPESNNPHIDGQYTIGAYTGTNGDQGASSLIIGKPAVGTDEWHKVRKDNHKEVERRRRETINEGINELAKIVPGCDKNKGAVLQRSVSYIGSLKENEARNIEKWSLEKMLTDQAIAELSNSVDKLKDDNRKLMKDNDKLKQIAQAAGIDIDAQETTTDHGKSR
ncbi:uncharacterized protein KY384_003793 [Bacidia gigantensis]|uniref:uncharacterized protein n=1 Tax=Bacidia gigantensis TaxID=2732470 RepID=UPI001D036901|nr:uncharacterized protein KY384_003793 [Bacidia gigantensis]KAG8532153.1 hypothetical protein KY384_003793 [Bacidia gigantensis]